MVKVVDLVADLNLAFFSRSKIVSLYSPLSGTIGIFMAAQVLIDTATVAKAKYFYKDV